MRQDLEPEDARDMANKISSEAVKEWLDTKRIIMNLTREIFAGRHEEFYDGFATALIARLASNNPPLLATYLHNIKD